MVKLAWRREYGWLGFWKLPIVRLNLHNAIFGKIDLPIPKMYLTRTDHSFCQSLHLLVTDCTDGAGFPNPQLMTTGKEKE